MNKEYIQSGNNIIVSTDDGLKRVKRVNNIKEILETENNIEEIENIETQIKEEHFFNYKNILNFVTNEFLKKTFGITIPIIIIITILMAVFSNIYIASVTAPMMLCGVGIVTILTTPISIYKAKKINKRISKNATELLDDELQKQNKKLNRLNKESKALVSYNLNIDKTVKIERSRLILDLKNKLDLIEIYQLNKKKYLKLKKEDNLLSELKKDGYSASDIKFIAELAINDLILENTTQKQKTLKLEKK